MDNYLVIVHDERLPLGIMITHHKKLSDASDTAKRARDRKMSSVILAQVLEISTEGKS